VLPQASRKAPVWWSKSREEPGAQKQRHPINQDQIRILGKTGSTQFLEQGLPPCSFFRSDSGFTKQQRVT
jgi:hypothetical protein